MSELSAAVEEQKYSPPKSGNLREKDSPGLLFSPEYKDDWIFRGARQLGFDQIGFLRLPKGTWDLWKVDNLTVPNFPEGETIINSRLGVYREEEETNRTVLRVSTNPIPDEEVQKDLEAFTKYYIHRPKYLGFPNKALTRVNDQFKIVIGSILLGGSAGYLASGETLGGVVGVFAGEITSMLGAPLGRKFGEQLAIKNISNPDEYYVGHNHVYDVLSNIRDHIITTAYKREFYSGLIAEGIQITPEEFLTEINENMGFTLPIVRQDEIDDALFTSEAPIPNPTILPSETTLKLLEAAKVLINTKESEKRFKALIA